MNKLLCTFCDKQELDSTISQITSNYSIIFNKIFILEAEETNQLLITYNIDPYNSNNDLLQDTISVHRKKETNSLYTINALNNLIKELNNGILDTNYKINWQNYSNSILLTNNDSYRKISTKVFKILYI